MSVTIHDVARRVGVSVKTVSRALNGRPDVSAATKAAVEEAAAVLGYVPSPLARGLRTGTTGMIGVLVPELLNPHYAEQARQLQALAANAGLVLTMANYDYDPKLALAHLRTFISHRFEGAILLGAVLDGEVLALLRSNRLPTVSPEGVPDGLEHIRSVRTAPGLATYETATYEAVSHLIALGHRRIAYVTEASDMVFGRVAAYCRALEAHGIPVDADLIKRSPLVRTEKLAGGYASMGELLAAGHGPTSVCTSSDLIAIGVLRALRERGLKVPSDVSVVGCDDIELAAYTDPPLTTIQAPTAARAAAMFALLRHLMDPLSQPEPVLEAVHSLVVRASTGPSPS